MKSNTKATSREEYLASIEWKRKERITYLDYLIRTNAPKLEPVFMSGMLWYWKYHYKYKSWREWERFVIGLANNKSYISFYSCLCKDWVYPAEKYEDKLWNVSVGKSCIRFKKLEDVNSETLKTIIQEAEEYAVSINFTYIDQV